MGIAYFGGRLFFPRSVNWRTSAPGYALPVMDASGERVALICEVPKSGTLDKFEFRMGTLTNTAAGVRTSFQDVTLASVPAIYDGSQDQYRPGVAVTANTWIVPALMTSDGTDTGTKRTVTKGELLACVVDFESFTAGDIVRPNTYDWQNSGIPSDAHSGLPYSTVNGAVHAAGNLAIALKYDDGTYAHISHDVLPYSALSQHTFNSGSTPDEIGIIWTPTVPCRVTGAWLRGDFDNVFDVVLYDSDGSTPQATKWIEANRRANAAGLSHFYTFASTYTLNAGSTYRLIAKPTSGSNIVLYYGDVNSAAIMDALEGGQSLHQTHRTNGGTWTETTTRRPMMGFVIDGLSDGGASVVRRPNRRGNFQN